MRCNIQNYYPQEQKALQCNEFFTAILVCIYNIKCVTMFVDSALHVE